MVTSIASRVAMERSFKLFAKRAFGARPSGAFAISRSNHSLSQKHIGEKAAPLGRHVQQSATDSHELVPTIIAGNLGTNVAVEPSPLPLAPLMFKVEFFPESQDRGLERADWGLVIGDWGQ
jgi:hypothetical protein